MEHIAVIELPSISEICDFAYESLQKLPKSFRAHLKNFVIDVQNFAESNTLQELSMDDKYALLGLYRGVPLPLKSKNNHKHIDTIHLYRCPLIRHALENQEEVNSLVHHVIINEIAHHFGCSAQEMALMQQYAKFSK